MSQESVDVVRMPLRARERASRTLDQRLSLRFPRLFAGYARWLARLPPSSRLRQASVRRAVALSIEAYNRRDLEAFAIGSAAQFEYHPARNVVEAGLVEPCYRGREGHRQYVAATAEVWGAEVHLKPVELIDLGDRLVVLADAPMRAQGSGVSLTEAFAVVSTIKDGKIVRYQEYFDHAEALEAVGLTAGDSLKRTRHSPP